MRPAPVHQWSLQNYGSILRRSCGKLRTTFWRNQLAKGDHFFVWRQHLGVPFQHHGIDLGDGSAVHFTDGDGGVAVPGGASANFVVMRAAMSMITRDGRDKIHVVQHTRPFDADAIVERALSRVGKRGYHVLFANCEHFASWCAIGSETSRQVRTACERLTSVGLKAAAAGTFRAVSRFGTRRLVRGASVWMLAAEAAQWATEAGGHHIGLRDPEQRRQAGRAVGGVAALGVGVLGGPIGMAVAGTMWVAGEVAGEASCRAYEKVRERRACE